MLQYNNYLYNNILLILKINVLLLILFIAFILYKTVLLIPNSLNGVATFKECGAQFINCAPPFFNFRTTYFSFFFPIIMQYIYIHIKEIKYRLVYCVFSFIVTLLCSYVFQYELLYFITRPVIGLQQKFIFLDLTEALSTIIQVCLWITFMMVSPYIIFHIWSFFIPSCYTWERIIINNFILAFFVLTFFQLCCIYFFIFPVICEFLSSFQFHETSQIQDSWIKNASFYATLQNIVNKLYNFLHDCINVAPQLENVANKFEKITCNIEYSSTTSVLIVELAARIQSYVKLICRLLIFILFFFQIPFFFIILYYNKYCTGYDLSINRKFYFFSTILFSAIISPPDLISQCFLISVLCILFEFLIFLGLVFHYSTIGYRV